MGKMILVADDSETIRKAVELTFHATEFSVVTSATGDDALTQLDRVNPDIVLADCTMDGLDGYTMCARIKDAGHSVPVVLMPSASNPLDPRRAELARATTSLTKPFDTKSLLTIVRRLTGSEALQDGPMTFADALARRSRPEPPPVPLVDEQADQTTDQTTDQSYDGGAAYAVASADIIIDDEPEIIDETDGLPLAAGPTLEPPAPPPTPDGISHPRPSVDMWALTDDANALGRPPSNEGHPVEARRLGSVHTVATTDMQQLSAAADGGRSIEAIAPPPEPAPPPAPAAPPEPISAPAINLSEDEMRAIVREAVQEAVEKVVWEVVPELAETIIREEIRRLTSENEET